jgi:hypothetical protein
MRRVAFALLIVACQETPDSLWRVLEVSEADGVTFEDVSVLGDRMWAVGARDGERGAVLVIDGDQWTAIDSPDLPPLGGVFAAAEDDIWVAANWELRREPGEEPFPPLWHWDGDTWTQVEPIPDLVSVGDVWGTATDDVWITAKFDADPKPEAALHWDGSAWTVHDQLYDLCCPIDPTFPEDASALRLRDGCSVRRDEVWVAGGEVEPVGSNSGVAFHFDGTSWTLGYPLQTDDGRMEAIACSHEGIWSIGIDNAEWTVVRWSGDAWQYAWQSPSVAPYRSFGAVWAGGQDVWVAGDELPDEDGQELAQIWQVTESEHTATIHDDIVVEPEVGEAIRAIGRDGRGRFLALGFDGLVFEHTDSSP